MMQILQPRIKSLLNISKFSALSVALILSGCASLPALTQRSESHVLSDTAETRLGRAAAQASQRHAEQLEPGKHGDSAELTGILALADGRDAFATRMLLAEAAERSLDVQYYIWHADLTGTFLLDALRQAANRGVRVRLLVDDNNTKGLDATFAAMDSHPLIEVRLFNPFMQRKYRWLGYLTNFGRLNRRMHNKSFTADNQVSVVGGRNIGDEYFDAGQNISFVDLDVLTTGAIVPQISMDFDRYWASASAYPVALLFPAGDSAGLARIAQSAERKRSDPAAKPYLDALNSSESIKRLIAGDQALEWAKVRLVSDDPSKGLGKAQAREQMPARLAAVLGKPESELVLVSPYFVPTASGTMALTKLAAGGVRVKVLTNSLAATDVPAVHAGYAKRRRALLRGGVALFELKPDQSDIARSKRSDRGLAGSSSASLHAKTFAMDRRRLFVGSFNLDPRSAALNTESGVVIESPALAEKISDAFDSLSNRSYTLHLNDKGAVEWHDSASATAAAQVYRTEPKTTWFKRASVKFLSWLPIEWLL